jgi:hypothetical protein
MTSNAETLSCGNRRYFEDKEQNVAGRFLSLPIDSLSEIKRVGEKSPHLDWTFLFNHDVSAISTLT